MFCVVLNLTRAVPKGSLFNVLILFKKSLSYFIRRIIFAPQSMAR